MNTDARRTLTALLDTIEQLIKTPLVSLVRLIRSIGLPNQVVRPTPRTLINKVYNKAKLEALPYGPNEPRVCPPYFDITVPQGSWEEFYRHDTVQICADIAERVYARILESETFTIDRTPVIDIACSLRPDSEGTTVAAHFYSTRTAPASRQGAGPEAASAEAAASEAQTVLIPCAESTALAGERPVGNAAAPQNAPQPDARPSARPEALLQGRDKGYLVHDGDVIGVVRGQSPVRPSVCLPLESFPFASREHARLAYDAATDTWTLAQLGRHGSCIVRDGKGIELSPGTSHDLATGDVIAIPRANDELRFSAEPIADTILLAR